MEQFAEQVPLGWVVYLLVVIANLVVIVGKPDDGYNCKVYNDIGQRIQQCGQSTDTNRGIALGFTCLLYTSRCV